MRKRWQEVLVLLLCVAFSLWIHHDRTWHLFVSREFAWEVISTTLWLLLVGYWARATKKYLERLDADPRNGGGSN